MDDGLYEYIAVYVDDLLVAARHPEEIISKLKEEHKFKLKGVGPLTYHLGCDYFRDNDDTLCYGPRKYIINSLINMKACMVANPKSIRRRLKKKIILK